MPKLAMPVTCLDKQLLNLSSTTLCGFRKM
jgi:hypothetical protein